MQIIKICSNIDISNKIKRIFKNLIISPSAYFINFGLEKDYNFVIDGIKVNNLLYFILDDTRRIFKGRDENKFKKSYFDSRSIFVSFQSSRVVRALILSPFSNSCNLNQRVFENIVNRMSFLKDFLFMVKTASFSTPFDLYNFTYNYKGACYGWLTLKTLKNFYNSFLNLYDNIFLCGHWVPNIFGNSGITGVINSGRKCAYFLLKKNKYV